MRVPGALWMLCLFSAGCGNREMTHSKAPEVVAVPQDQSIFELIDAWRSRRL